MNKIKRHIALYLLISSMLSFSPSIMFAQEVKYPAKKFSLQNAPTEPLRKSDEAVVAPMGSTSATVNIILAQCEIKIRPFWSDQFPNVQFNQLPGKAGREGSRRKQILMGARGARDGFFAYAKAEIDVIPSDPSVEEKIAARLALRREGVIMPIPVGDGSVSGKVASMWTFVETSGPVPHDYDVIVWIDENDNGELDENERFEIGDGRFTIVSDTYYEANRALLIAAARAGTVFPIPNIGPVPRSSAFALSFLENGSIDYGGVHNPSFISFEDIESALKSSLSYHVGVDFSLSGTGTVRNFFFGANSDMADDVRASETFEQMINDLLEANQDIVLASYPNSVEFEWPMPQLIEYEDPRTVDGLGDLDSDLFFVFGTANLKATLQVMVQCIDGNIQPSSLTVTGSLIDLYDFDYTASREERRISNVDRMAIVQAGYGTLGNGGNIFRTEIRLDNTSSNYLFNFGECSN